MLLRRMRPVRFVRSGDRSTPSEFARAFGERAGEQKGLALGDGHRPARLRVGLRALRSEMVARSTRMFMVGLGH